MEVSMEQQPPPSPMRLLEILKDRFGALEAVANASIKLARYAPEHELAMDLLVAESVLEFGSSLREARDGAMQWAKARGWHLLGEDGTAAAAGMAAVSRHERVDCTARASARGHRRRRAPTRQGWPGQRRG
jgi:hypothetical protein